MTKNDELSGFVAAGDGVGMGTLSNYSHAIMERIDKGLTSNSSLQSRQVSGYRTISEHIISHMSQDAIKRWLANVSEVRYYSDLDSLRAGTGFDSPHVRGGLDAEGNLHLNSGDSFAEMAHIHTHEFAHGIDGYNFEISGSPEWQQAWQKEIVDSRPLSHYSQTDAHEGFAEFGRLVLSGLRPAIIEQDYPGCYAVWHSHRLLP